MKLTCVVALALLFSAQALKMENRPSFAATRQRLNKKLGRTEKKAPFTVGAATGLLKSGVMAALDAIYATDEWDYCGAYTVMACLEELSSYVASMASLDSGLCAYIDMYYTDAEFLCGDAAETYVALGSMDDGFAGYFSSSKAMGDLKVVDYEMILVDTAFAFWNFWGAIDDVQGLIWEYEYCEYIISYVMWSMLDDGSFDSEMEAKGSASAELQNWLTNLMENKYGGTGPGGGSVDGLGGYGKAAYAAAKDWMPGDARLGNKFQYRRMLAKKEMHRNKRDAKMGKGRSYKKGRSSKRPRT